MKRLLTGSILFLVVSLAIPDVLMAQEFRDVELNLFAAGSAHTKNRYEVGFPQAVTPIQSQFRMNDTIRGGLRFNVHTSGHWGEEFFFSYEPNKARFIRDTAPAQESAYDIRVFNFGVNALYYLNEEESRRTRPFISFGIGGTVYQPTAQSRRTANDPLRGNLPGFESSAELALNYGVGFKRVLTERYSLRMDFRGFVNRNPSFGLPRSSNDPNQVVFPADGAIHNMEASAGIVIKLKK
jgi:hypothetical protein